MSCLWLQVEEVQESIMHSLKAVSCKDGKGERSILTKPL